VLLYNSHNKLLNNSNSKHILLLGDRRLFRSGRECQHKPHLMDLPHFGNPIKLIASFWRQRACWEQGELY